MISNWAQMTSKLTFLASPFGAAFRFMGWVIVIVWEPICTVLRIIGRAIHAIWMPILAVLWAIGWVIYVLWKFTYYDLSTSVIPSTILSLVSLHAKSRSQSIDFWDLVTAVGVFAVAYFWSYIASFNISNQIDSIKEDAVNKPDRPLPSGLITVRGAWAMYIVAMLAFDILGWVAGCLICSITWQIVILFHNHMRLAGRWGVKSWSMTTGTIAMLSAAWIIGGAPLTVAPFLWLCTIAFLLFPTCPIQDLRDQKGDKLEGRKTLPLLIGDRNARIVLSVVFMLNPFVTLFVSLKGPWEITVTPGILISFNTIIFLISWAIAIRLVLFRNKAADHRSYMLYTYWFVFCLAFGIFLL